jgi:predicted acetyltransferase
MAIEIRPITADELPAFVGAMSVPFGFDAKPELLERFKNRFEFARLRAAVDGGKIVGTFGALSCHLTVPGGSIPMAGTSVVSVAPTHRRQGILRAFMADHFAELHRDGEGVAGLWASESSIYGRFGYGPASELARVKLEKAHAAIAQPVALPGAMQLLNREEALATFPEVYDKVVANRPGMFRRSPGWWEHRALADHEEMRDGATAHRRVLHVRDAGPVGYALYRTRQNRERQENTAIVIELVGIDAPAERALWQYLFGIDLITTIEYWNQPVDSPLVWWLADPRRLERRIVDGLWLRPVDVIKTLDARRYARPGSLVFKVNDELCPWNEGTYQLDVGEGGHAQCRRTDRAAEVELTATGLGALYLGGHRFQDLARAGVIHGDSETLRRADGMFASGRLPWCQEIF